MILDTRRREAAQEDPRKTLQTDDQFRAILVEASSALTC
jgi:hypothetical protein